MTGQDFAQAPAVQQDDTLEAKKRLSSQNDEEGFAKEQLQQPLDPYGDEVGAAVQYKTMKWWQGAIGTQSRQPYTLTT